MFYYEVGTDDTERRWDYRLSFHMRGIINKGIIDRG